MNGPETASRAIPASDSGAGRAFAPSYKWWVVFMLWLVCFLNYADRQTISSVLPLLKDEYHMGKFELGLVGSAFMWVYAAMAPFAGMTADRVSRKWILISACVIWSFFTLATAWCTGLGTLASVRALTGLGETFYFPAAMALLSDYHSRQSRSRAMSWHQSAVYAGTILGSWIAAVLAERCGWRFPFYFFGPVGILMAVILLVCLREPERNGAEKSQSGSSSNEPRLPLLQTVGVVFRTPAAVLLMAGFVCANFVATIFMTWTPTFLVEKFHYSLGGAGLTGTLYINLASAVTVPMAGILADRLSRRFAAGRMIVQGIGLVLGMVFVFLVADASTTWMLVVTMTCFGACKGFYDSGIFASLYDVIDPRARGTAAGLMNTIGWGGGALGPLFVGWVSQHGTRSNEVENMSHAIGLGAFVYLAAAICLAAAIVLVNRKNRIGTV